LVSKFFESFIKNEIAEKSNFDECIEDINIALSATSHLVRIRSIARAAGFCAYYARMSEKMGVMEVLEGSGIGRGRVVHRILGLASLLMFSEKADPSSRDVEAYIDRSINELGIDVDDETRAVVGTLLQRLVKVLPKAKDLLGLALKDPLFPIVEQQFMDFRVRMYGAPDLILENPEKRKAIVIEWKTYSVDDKKGGVVHDYEKAQVLAYSILEARRLGMTKYSEVFRAITGLTPRQVRKAIRKFYEGSMSDLDILKLLTQARENVMVLPIIVGRSGGYPPSPFPELYVRRSPRHAMKRFEKMYKLFKGVIVAAEFLTLQITNVPELVKTVTGIIEKDLKKEIEERCKSKKGSYPVYSYTPFGILKAGKPGEWDKYPCKICPFKGDGGPCDFYFSSSKPKDYFDKLMWWARYTVFREREKDLINHMAMYILFSHSYARRYILERSSHSPVEFKVIIGPQPQVAKIKRKYPPVVNVVHVFRGEREESRFRFEVFDINGIEVEDENTLKLVRPLRPVEKVNELIGVIRKSIILSLINPKSAKPNPLLSINTFVFLDDEVEFEGVNIVYKAYVPSPVLQYSFKLFSKYVEVYKSNGINALIVAFEAPVDLTIMELRAVDAIHRYIKSDQSVREVLKQHGVNEDEVVQREKEIVEKFSPTRDDVIESESTIQKLRELLKEKIMRVKD